MGTLAFDLRDAVRGFRRDRAYALITTLTLALTIGATTAVFSIVDGVLLKPLAYRDSHRLVSLREIWREVADRIPALEVNERHFEYWRAHASSFESLAQYLSLSGNLTGIGEARQITVVHASGSLFDVLRVSAATGRTLMPSDDAEGAADVVTITDALWRQRLGADPAIVGKPLVLDGRPYEIVGVLPAGFRLPSGDPLGVAADAFIPLRLRLGWVGDHNNQAIGRLRDDVTVERARAELDVLQEQVSQIATQRAGEPVTLASVVTPLTEHIVGRARRGLLLLLAAIGAVLLIACSNLANLSLTRTLGRLHEAAVRTALGASRRRLVTKALLEQLVLSLAGGGIGIWVAWIGLALFVKTAPIDLPRMSDVALDARVLTFAVIVTMVASVLVSMVPAWRIAGRDAQAALRAKATAVIGDRRGLRSHATLLVVQVGLSVALLAVAALFGASFQRVLAIDRGFVAEQVLVVDIAMPASRYAEEPVRRAAYDRLLAAVHALPGVEGASTTSMLPLRGGGQTNFVVPEGSTLPVPQMISANYRFVAPEFFRTLGIPVRRGRSFADNERDPNRPLPVLISEPTAARVWPGEDPIGKRFSRGQQNERGFEVVGVVADARTTVLDRAQPLMVYVPYWWRSRAATSLLIKTAVDASSIVSSVRRVVHEIDPDIAVGQSRPLEQLVEASVAGRRYQTQLFVTFGAVAMFIAIVGVYAVTSYGVSRRRREMNIRVALGAHYGQVVGLVLRQSATPVIIGVVAGAGVALAIGGLVASLLFEVQARDPFILLAVVVIVGVVGVATCGVAARRGLTIQPAAALREE